MTLRRHGLTAEQVKAINAILTQAS